MQLGDVLHHVLQELLPNRLCDYLKEVRACNADNYTRYHTSIMTPSDHIDTPYQHSATTSKR